MGMSSHQSAAMKSDEWLTPPEIMAKLGSFDLDPCAPVRRPWDTALWHYDVNDDGLSMPWHGRVWLNPPFGREAVKWLRRLKDHGNGIALIPARTETAMFYECVWGGGERHPVYQRTSAFSFRQRAARAVQFWSPNLLGGLREKQHRCLKTIRTRFYGSNLPGSQMIPILSMGNGFASPVGYASHPTRPPFTQNWRRTGDA
jgi:hypothetical protein